MLRNYSLIIITFLTSFVLRAQDVTNVLAIQRGKNVEISYDLDKNATINICYSTDGGRTYSAPLQKVSGDVGKGVTAGHKTIIWDVLSEVGDLISENLIFKVTTGIVKNFIINDITFDMILVEGGNFDMERTNEQGNDVLLGESSIHTVTLTDFYIGKFEVTQGLWECVMKKSVSQIAREKNLYTFSVGEKFPMYYISWNDCQEFVRKLNVLLSSQLEGQHFSLPTGAQWEYAARGGNMSIGYTYSGGNNVNEVAWYKGNSSSVHPVGTKSPNELGIYDMSGNVSEWCLDRKDATISYGIYFEPEFVVCGGSWMSDPYSCFVSSHSFNPSYPCRNVGFRLVLIP